MIEQLPQASIMREQLNNRAYHAQLRACRAARAHSPQPTITSRVRRNDATEFRQHGEGNRHQREHPCPGCETTDTGRVETKQSFGITKAFFAGKAPRVLMCRSLSRQVAVRQQMPVAPSPLFVTRSGLHQEEMAGVALTVPEAAPSPSSLILGPLQRVEPPPPTFDLHRVVRLRADDVRNAHFIEQIEKINVGEPPIRRQHEAAARDARQDLSKEQAHKLALIAAHPLLQVCLRVGSPVERDAAPPDAQASDQQMLRVFNRPVEREAHATIGGQSPDERRGVRSRQRFRVEPRVVQEAEQAFAGSFKVVKESGKPGLAASPHAQESEHEITDGLLLMPMCIWQNEADILAQASGKRALVHRRNNALTRGELVPLAYFFKCVQTSGCGLKKRNRRTLGITRRPTIPHKPQRRGEG
jgi:hypothetical protein